MVVSLTHERIADLAGTVREVVTRHLARLEKQGFVRIEPRRILITDAEALSESPLCRTHQR